MKGVILAGGYGTRLGNLTKVVNKHLLPVWDQPMIYHPIRTLVEAGVTDIMIVTGGRPGDFIRLLGSGKQFHPDLNLHYVYQDGAGGIPAALNCARQWVGTDSVCVLLGDNIFEPGAATNFIRTYKGGGRIFLKEVPDPNRFGVAVLRNGDITHIQEKPQEHISPYAITGLYLFDMRVWNVIDQLQPSDRGELEVVDIHRHYLKLRELEYQICDGYWTDAGTHESLFRANALAREIAISSSH